jgi:glycolate oxidase FAD binding subunit
VPAIAPTSAEELAHALAQASLQSQTISVIGNGSKHQMGGPALAADLTISTAGLRRILQYEPNDLTISVEAGLPWRELQETLAAHGQMIAIDPPFATEATVGGVIATNSSGPMRRAFGTARDQVIGMSFATLAGKIVKSGGMVVKNVAGLDMAKLMIGSFGTLAVVASVNFRVHALPRETRTFAFSFPNLDTAIHMRDSILRSVLQPHAIDLVNPPAAARLGSQGYLLAVRAGGSRAVLDRYRRELQHCEELTGETESHFWQDLCEFAADFLRREPGGIVLRISTPLSDVRSVFECAADPCISRAGSGMSYIYAPSWESAAPVWNAARQHGWSAVMEYSPDEIRASKDLWFSPRCGADSAAFAIMKRVKQLFDPNTLLNRSRLYGRI